MTLWVHKWGYSKKKITVTEIFPLTFCLEEDSVWKTKLQSSIELSQPQSFIPGLLDSMK